MKTYFHWIFILAVTLTKLHEVSTEDDKIVEILFVNDMQYGFYPIDTAGNICNDGYENICKGGLARLVKELELQNPISTTVPDEVTATTEVTTPTDTTTSIEETSTTTKQTNKNEIIETNPQNIYIPQNALFLNAGNYLHSQNNNWFDLLKFKPAAEALKSLSFSAIAIGPDVLQYGEMLGSTFLSDLNVLAANVEKSDTSSLADVAKSHTILISGVNVTIIGFLGKFDKEKYYGGFKITDPKTAITAEIKKQKTERKRIFIAIGTADNELATEIAKIEGMNIVIFSGSNVTEGDSVFLKVVTPKTSWIASTKPPADKETHVLLGKLTIKLNKNLDIDDVKPDQHNYRDGKKTTNDSIIAIEKKGIEELKMKNDVLAKPQVELGGNQSCSVLEYILGDIVTDAMKRAMEKTYKGGVAIWNLQGYPPLVEAEKSITEEDVYELLGKGKDENMYVVPLSPKEIKSLLEESMDSMEKNVCSSLQIAGLYVNYGSWEKKGKRIKRIRTSNDSMELEDLDLKSENRTINVIVPSHLMNKLPPFSTMTVSDLGLSVGQAVVEFIQQTKLKNDHLFLSPLGFRYVSVNAPEEINKCHDNAGEAVLLTIAVIVMIGALGLLTWYFIIPRIRQRRGSTMPLIY